MTQRYSTMFFKSKFKNNLEDLVEGPDHLKWYTSMQVHCKCFIQNVPCIMLDLLFCLFASAMLPHPLPCNVTYVTKHSPLHFDIINLLLQCPYCNLVRIDKSDLKKIINEIIHKLFCALKCLSFPYELLICQKKSTGAFSDCIAAFL